MRAKLGDALGKRGVAPHIYESEDRSEGRRSAKRSPHVIKNALACERKRETVMTIRLRYKLVENIGRARGTDYFLMKEQLTPDEAEILVQVREFGETEVCRSSIHIGSGASFRSNSFQRSRR